MNRIMEISVHGAQLSRRGFMATGGALVASVYLLPSAAKAKADAAAPFDASQATSWIEIHADNTVMIRTGKCDFGQSSIYTAYPQIVAEELYMPFEAITAVVSGDTDCTPDGGTTAGLLNANVLNLRKVAAYMREAVLELASQQFGVPKERLSIKDGVFSGGGKSATYGKLIEGQDLHLTIPLSGELTGFFGLTVMGDPPLKPTSRYTVVGKPYKNSSLKPKLTGKTTWVGDVKLPGMAHARVIHPKTLGSTLVSAGKIDSGAYPNSRVVVIGNLVAVVAPTEWEAVRAARQVSDDTEWSDWKGLPGHEKFFDHLRDEVDWGELPAADGQSNTGDVPTAAVGAAKMHSASYDVPYMKHAPIGPMVSLADVRPDGSVTIHTCNQNPQRLRGMIAKMLNESEDKVIIRTYPGAGHYGRSNGGSAGSEDEAALISREIGQPARVQWMREDDMQWSAQSPGTRANIRIGLDENGRITSYEAEHYSPPMQDDRLVGAVLAGLPTIAPPTPDNASYVGRAVTDVYDKWVYDDVANVAEKGYCTYQIGERNSPIAVGLRDHSLRTPGQYQQNFSREVAISEAAALVVKDPLQFRIDHLEDQRFKDILTRLRAESGWVTRPSPAASARATGDTPMRGQGVSIMWRGNGYWACASQVAVTPSTGEVKVERITVVLDLGIVVNPLQLERQVQAGSLMGVSQALHEELTFDESTVTSTDWMSYPILTMEDMPDVKVVITPRPDVGKYAQGSEGANGLVPAAIAAAFFDATGKSARRIPLKPKYVKAMLEA